MRFTVLGPAVQFHIYMMAAHLVGVDDYHSVLNHVQEILKKFRVSGMIPQFLNGSEKLAMQNLLRQQR